MSFPHLHVASGWSLRHGASSPELLVEVAAERGLTTLALTDRDGVRGAVRFARAAMSAGIATVFGTDLALVGSDVRGPTSPLRPYAPVPYTRPVRAPVKGGRSLDPRSPRVTVLAQGPHGWGALCRLVSAAHVKGEALTGRGQPVVDLPLIAEYAADGALVVLLGPDSDVGRLLARQRPDLATDRWRLWQSQIPQLWCEVVNHRGADPAGRSAAFAGRMLRWAHEQRARALLTNTVRYARREDAPVADVLDAARRLVPLDIRHIDRRTGEGYLKSSTQMAEVASRGGTSFRSRHRASDESAAARSNRAAGTRVRTRPDRSPRSGIGSLS